MDFEWDDAKNAANLAKHGIDFVRAVEVFEGHIIEEPSDRAGEPRWLAIGMAGGLEIAVIFTWRGAARRIISARRARDDERGRYRESDRRRSAAAAGERS